MFAVDWPVKPVALKRHYHRILNCSFYAKV